MDPNATSPLQFFAEFKRHTGCDIEEVFSIAINWLQKAQVDRDLQPRSLKINQTKPLEQSIWFRVCDQCDANNSGQFKMFEIVSPSGNLLIDFFTNQTKYWRPISKHNDLLAKACGKSKTSDRNKKIVWDLTAGLAEDSMLMARLGFKVQSFERNPAIFYLLQQARAILNFQLKSLSEFETPVFTNADFLNLDITKLPAVTPNIIYYDPMFVIPNRTAKPKKEIQVLHDVLSLESNSENEEILVLKKALKIASEKVIVKRWIKAPPVLEKPNFIVKGNSVRFDCYLTGR